MSEHKAHTLDDIARMAAVGHSVFSPSSSKMWLTCSGSLIPNILAHDETSAEAAEGTVAHSVAEEWLRTGKRPRHLIGTTVELEGHEIEIDDEMMAYVGDYVALVQELEDEAVEFLTETRVDFSNLTPIPDQGGTSDNIAILPREDDDSYEMIVTDLKYGKGVRVIAEGNTQGQLYAYGAFRLFRDKYKITRIRIRICHPRLEGGTTEFFVSPEQLLDFARYAKQRAHDAWQFDAPRTPSDDGCQWCKVKATCPALYKHLAEVTSDTFEDDDEFEPRSHSGDEQRQTNEELEDELGPHPFRPINPAKLSTKALAKILRYRKLMENFFNGVEAELLDRAIAGGQDVPGWKIVEGRSKRRWPENDAPVYLRLRRLGLKDTAIYEQSMISPRQAEDKLHAKAGLSKESAAKIVNSLAVKPPGPKSLVRTSDNRPALASDADAFLDDDPFER